LANAEKFSLSDKITQNIRDICLAPSDKGKYWDISLKAGGETNVKLKFLGKASAEALFNKGEWEGVQKILRSQQATDNASYRDCVKTLTPLFINKFVPSKQSKSKENKSGNKQKSINENIAQSTPTALPATSSITQNIDKSPGSTQLGKIEGDYVAGNKTVNIQNKFEGILVNNEKAKLTIQPEEPQVIIHESEPEIIENSVNHVFHIVNNGKLTVTNISVEIVCFSKDIIDVNLGDNSSLDIRKEPILPKGDWQKVFLSVRRLVSADKVVFTIRSSVADASNSVIPLPIVNSIIFDQGKGLYSPYKPKGPVYIGSGPPSKNM